MEDLPTAVASVLNDSSLEPYTLRGSWEAVQKFAKNNEAGLSPGNRGNLSNLEFLLSKWRWQTDALRKEHPGFAPFEEEAFPPESFWEFVLEVSDRLNRAVMGAILDDILLGRRNSLERKEGFSFKDLISRTIQRYLEKAQFLWSQPKAERGEYWENALFDSLGRTVELCVRFSQPDKAKECMILLREIIEFYYSSKDWERVCWCLMNTLPLAEKRDFGGLVSSSEETKYKVWAKESAQGLAIPDAPPHLVTEANLAAARFGRLLGEPEPFREAKRRTAELVAGMAEKTAANGNRVLASHLIEQSIILFREVGATERAERLSLQKTKWMGEALEAGEFIEIKHKVEVPPEVWEAFIGPFQRCKGPEEALDLWISHPDFVDFQQEYESVVEELKYRAPLVSEMRPPSVIDEMGLQTRSASGTLSKEQGVRKDILSSIIHSNAALFLDPAFDFIRKQKSVTLATILERLEGWPLGRRENVEVAIQGIKRHWEGDFISSLHILIPQFEALLRNAFSGAGYVDAIETEYSKTNGLTQGVRTFGNFLSRPDVRKALEEPLVTHFRLLFTDPDGLNLRNRIAHGLVEEGMFQEHYSTLVLHSVLLLTRLQIEERNT